ncbi:MAG: LysM peptidoglycan-binding domain-containing protein [Verrucomicrobia bacterium]|nr:LysM peptidoglycan-binding domain-containing protein [Verrucomicrobiota bacterium]
MILRRLLCALPRSSVRFVIPALLCWLSVPTSTSFAALSPAELADLRSRAEAGDPGAQHTLGLAFADPTDPVANAAEAYAWLTLAGEQGANLGPLQRLLDRLSPAQLAEGKRLLDARRAVLARQAREASPFVGSAAGNAAAASSTVVVAAADAVQTVVTPVVSTAVSAPSAAGSGSATKEAALGKIAELNQLVSVRDQRISVLEGELAALRSQPNPRDLQQQLAAKSQLLAASDAERETLSQRTAVLSAEVDTLRAQFAAEQKWGAELVRSEQVRKELEAERDLLQKQLSAGTSTDAQASADLVRRAEEAEANLATALRSYTVQSGELDQLRAALVAVEAERASLAARLADTESAKASLGTELVERSAGAAEADRLREQLRQTQLQAAATALELNQLRIRLAITAPSPSTTLSSPTRPGAADAVALAAPPPEALPAAGAASATDKPAARSHTVQPGDTLSRIAQRYYGNGRRWNEILAANKALIPDPDRLAIGTTLVIP